MPRSTLSRFTVISGGARRFHLQHDGLQDELWSSLRQETIDAYARAPMLCSLFMDSILNQPSFEAAVFHRVASRLKNDVVGLAVFVEASHRALAAQPSIGETLRADIAAVVERDPACERFLEPFLYFKGFHAIQTHRLAHWLWHNGERDLALDRKSVV